MVEVKVEVDCQVVDLFDIPSSQGSQGSDDHPPSPPPPPVTRSLRARATSLSSTTAATKWRATEAIEQLLLGDECDVGDS